MTIVHPVRAKNLWNIQRIDMLDKQILSTKARNLKATYLVQYDALFDPEIISRLKHIQNENEIGIFLEVSEKLATDAHVPYLLGNGDWARPDKVFLSGYTLASRLRMTDTIIRRFREVFDVTPRAVGAWYIDPQTLVYLHDTYGVIASMNCSDQYSTDKYHLWGQYWSVPYYPSKFNSLTPAQSPEHSTGVVNIQWALRDPYHGYGATAYESTFSLQANDYRGEAHAVTTEYFKSIFSLYTGRKENRFGQVTVGLEAGSDIAYVEELDRQIAFVAEQSSLHRLKATTMSEFAFWYSGKFPVLSPSHVIATDIHSEPFSLWYMSPWYRANIIFENGKVSLRDFRRYDDDFIEQDFLRADKREILYHTITADVDDLVLKNAVELFTNVENIALEQTAVGINIVVDQREKIMFTPTSLDLTTEVALPRTTGVFESNSLLHTTLPLLVWNEYTSEYNILFATSVISGQRIFGIPIAADSLYGFGIHPFQTGRFSFPIQTLSHFQRFPRFSLSWLVQSDPSHQVNTFIRGYQDIEIVARHIQSLPNISEREAKGSKRIFENSEYSVWTN